MDDKEDGSIPSDSLVVTVPWNKSPSPCRRRKVMSRGKKKEYQMSPTDPVTEGKTKSLVSYLGPQSYEVKFRVEMVDTTLESV